MISRLGFALICLVSSLPIVDNARAQGELDYWIVSRSQGLCLLGKLDMYLSRKDDPQIIDLSQCSGLEAVAANDENNAFRQVNKRNGRLTPFDPKGCVFCDADTDSSWRSDPDGLKRRCSSIQEKIWRVLKGFKSLSPTHLSNYPRVLVRLGGSRMEKIFRFLEVAAQLVIAFGVIIAVLEYFDREKSDQKNVSFEYVKIFSSQDLRQARIDVTWPILQLIQNNRLNEKNLPPDFIDSSY